MDLIDIYRTFHPKEAKYTFISNTHGTFSQVDDVIGHNTSLKKLKKIEIISSIISNHSGLKLETNFKETTQKYSNTWRLNIMLLIMNGLTMRLRKKSKNSWKQMKMNTPQLKT